MVQDVVVPQMGESVLEGTVLEWKVKVGDAVSLNQPLVELMTDKVNVEIPAEVAGTLTHQFAQEGDVVPVGAKIATIDDGQAGSVAAVAPAAAVPAGSAPAAAPAAAKAPAPKPKAPIAATGRCRQGQDVAQSADAHPGVRT